MIYMDHAATSQKKPKEVIDAVIHAMEYFGNPGRGGHGATLDASRCVYECRKELTEFFHGRKADHLVFTANATEALNIAIKGFLRPGDHVITTCMEHNSVLRPLYELEEQGVALSILEPTSGLHIQPDQVRKAIRDNTRALVCTHASNLTGSVNDLKALGQVASEAGIAFLVDASQTAGILPIHVEEMKIDVLCFTGHKALLGPQGTGGMYIREGMEIQPLLSGGSGIMTYSKTHPRPYPERLEAGTLNTHGIAGLLAALGYLRRHGVSRLYDRERQMTEYFLNEVQKIEGIRVYHEAYGKTGSQEFVPIVALNVRDYDSQLVSDELYERWHIATRGGGHCAPLMHRFLHTEDRGAVRFSFSNENTDEELEMAIDALRHIAM